MLKAKGKDDSQQFRITKKRLGILDKTMKRFLLNSSSF